MGCWVRRCWRPSARRMFYRTAYFLPYVIASVVNVQIWRQILHPILGIGPLLAAKA